MALIFYKWLLTGVLAAFHPFYVSVTEINHNAKEKKLEISCKIFLEDTEKALEKQTHEPVELSSPKDTKKAQDLVSGYVKKHLLLKVDGKTVALEFVGYEVEGASLWSYYQVSNIPGLHKLDITDNLLYDMYDSQTGIVHVQVGDNKKSSRVNYPAADLNFDF
jgi:hypothetical protein